jgi:hypothetical protein
MKKLLLISLALLVGIVAFSQATKVSQNLLNTPAQTEFKKPISDLPEVFMPVNPTVSASRMAVNETVVGKTFYDLQSNTSLANRIVIHPDGTMGATWTRGMEATTFPDRGTGYNFFDGSAWGPEPTARVETVRTGWPSYSTWGPAGEVLVSHTGGANGLAFLTRETRGTGAWTESYIVGPEGMPDVTWPRIITSGENNEYIHMLSDNDAAASFTGQSSSMFYSRSSDGGATWDINMMVLDGTGIEYYNDVSADEYTLASKGDIVAILVADAWKDMFLLKSLDNGESWEKTVIWEHPYPFFVFGQTELTDTFFTVDNSASLAIGPDGKVHVVFGISRAQYAEVSTTQYSFYPWIDGIGYWNEDMPVFSNSIHALAGPQYEYEESEMIENYNYIGWSQDVDGNGTLSFATTVNQTPMSYRELGLSTMPNISIDDQGRLFVAWASTTETYDNIDYNFKKIWARAYDNGEWGPFVHVTNDIVHIFDESIYPTMPLTTSGNAVYVMYQADGLPGTALDSDHDYQENRMIVAAIDYSDLLTGLGKENQLINESSVSQNYPNPFNGTSTITVNLEKSANLSMVVTNMVGQQVMSFNRGQVAAGTYFFQVNSTNLTDGIYFYTVKADNSSVTKKMVVK